MAIILLPQTSKLIETKLKIHLTKVIKIIILIIGLIVFVVTIDTSEITQNKTANIIETKEEKPQQEERTGELKQTQKKSEEIKHQEIEESIYQEEEISALQGEGKVDLVNNWYEGGSLHKATILDWKIATEKNKLATCADFIATVDNSVLMSELKERALNLQACINEATKDVEDINNQAVSGIAASCITIMGY